MTPIVTSEGCESSIRSRSRKMYDLAVAGKPGDVCDVLHASRRDTYICTSEHMRRQPIMHTFRREQSLKIRHCSAFARARDLFRRRRDRIIVSRYIAISQLRGSRYLCSEIKRRLSGRIGKNALSMKSRRHTQLSFNTKLKF